MRECIQRADSWKNFARSLGVPKTKEGRLLKEHMMTQSKIIGLARFQQFGQHEHWHEGPHLTYMMPGYLLNKQPTNLN